MDNIPDLRLIGKATEDRARYNLERFLYRRPKGSNGKKIDIRWFFKKIEDGELIHPKFERLPLVNKILEELQYRLDSGSSISSIDTQISVCQVFFDFCSEHNLLVNTETAINRYQDFCEYLFLKEAKGEIKGATAYGYGCQMSGLLGSIFEIPDSVRLIKRTRLRHSQLPLRAVSLQSDKQNLSHTNELGTFCFYLCKGLTKKTILGHLPIQIEMPERIVKDKKIDLLNPQLQQTIQAIHRYESGPSMVPGWKKVDYEESRAVFKPIRSIKGTRRYYYVNLRVICEFLIFLAQTGCNISVATNLEREKFKYKPTSEGYRVRVYKKRRGGEVELNIYKSYKSHLNDYIEFLNEFMPDSKLLFPLYSYKHQGEYPSRINFKAFRKLLKKYNVPWTSASIIRKTRVNWVLRRSADEELTADMHDHTLNVMKRRYEQPSLQRSLVEISKFWNQNTPLEIGEKTTSIIASTCSGLPRGTSDKPDKISEPNCTYPSGCLWCENHRDRESFDYIWSLISFRHLKSIEASLSVQQEETAPDIVIKRITEKISWYREHSDEGRRWADEAELRIKEGDYHQNFSQVIQFLE